MTTRIKKKGATKNYESKTRWNKYKHSKEPFINYEKVLETLLQKSGKESIKITLLLVVQMHYWLQACGWESFSLMCKLWTHTKVENSIVKSYALNTQLQPLSTQS